MGPGEKEKKLAQTQRERETVMMQERGGKKNIIYTIHKPESQRSAVCTMVVDSLTYFTLAPLFEYFCSFFFNH